jgi:hypothetical protein
VVEDELQARATAATIRNEALPRIGDVPLPVVTVRVDVRVTSV